ncbi:transporter substrate-binding domain-containing protein [Aliamphritea ceti]|uniref:transporter substrate-binding domain-containing protein n=1 Tax=Aliamphritea ceti TaxID=1524258 RepID=UPI0021C44124|nr:transporter substrate-binding domain-containing protein [Aliamphritea ceti]
MTNRIKTLLSLSAILLSSFSLTSQAETIRIAIDGSFAPFAIVDNSGVLSGFDVDIANALCQQMQADCKIVSQPWDGMIPGLRVKKFDAIISSMSITEERSKVVDFSEKYYSNSLVLLGAKERQFDTSDAGLQGLTIGAYRATVSSQYLEDNYSGDVDIKLYDTQENAYLDMKSGRIDLLVSDKFPAYDWLQSADGQDYEFKGSDIDIQDQIAIAVRKGSALKQAFSDAISAIVANGQYAEINRRYFPFSIY